MHEIVLLPGIYGFFFCGSILYNRVIIAAFAKISKSYEEQSIDQIKVYAEIVTA